MIYVTGDTHGFHSRFAPACPGRPLPPGRLPGMDGWTEADTLLIAGDFGYLWSFPGGKYYEEEQEFLDYLSTLPFEIAFCDGNHENFDLLNALPVEEWRGGRTHRLRRNIHHLMRGELFTMEGQTIFVFGGAASTDRAARVPGISWWREELAGTADYRRSIETLRRCGMQVDYILTHTAPQEIIRRMGYEPFYNDREMTGHLEWIYYEVAFQHWYFGHFHEDRTIGGNMTALLNCTVPLGAPVPEADEGTEEMA